MSKAFRGFLESLNLAHFFLSLMFGSRLGRNGSWICSSCVRQRILLTARQKRSISQRYVAKVDSAEEQWKGFCEEIEAGKRQSMLRILEERGYINAIAG